MRMQIILDLKIWKFTLGATGNHELLSGMIDMTNSAESQELKGLTRALGKLFNP